MRNLILLFISIICTINVSANTFTYDIQQAGYAFEKYDQKGKATYSIFVKEFRDYPWKEQVGASKGGSEPTISVKNKTINIDLFVSVVGKPDDFAYLVGIVKLKKFKPLVSTGKIKIVRWVSVYLTEQPSDVENIFKLFFNNQVIELNSNLEKLPLFIEQEAINQKNTNELL